MATASQNGQQVTATESNPLVPPQSVMTANWLADLKELMRLRRYKLGQEWGVPASLMEPSPGNISLTQNLPPTLVQPPPAFTPPPANGSGNLWKGALLGAGLLGAGVAAGVLTHHLMTPAANTKTTVDNKTNFVPGEYDIKWKFNSATGKIEFADPTKVP